MTRRRRCSGSSQRYLHFNTVESPAPPGPPGAAETDEPLILPQSGIGVAPTLKRLAAAGWTDGGVEVDKEVAVGEVVDPRLKPVVQLLGGDDVPGGISPQLSPRLGVTGHASRPEFVAFVLYLVGQPECLSDILQLVAGKIELLLHHPIEVDGVVRRRRGESC